MPDVVPLWTTKDGQEIPINQLTDQHLRNICRMLLRNGQASMDSLALHLLEMAATMQGDMAIYALESQAHALSSGKVNIEDIDPIAAIMYGEAERRKLDWVIL